MDSRREQKVGAEVPVPRGPGRKPGVTRGATKPNRHSVLLAGEWQHSGEGLIAVQALKEGSTPGNSC